VPAIEAAALLRAFGIPLVDARIASNASEAAEVAGAVGYPVALKIESPDIAHKTEAGGVRLGLTSAAAVREAAEQILDSAREFAPDAEISGILVQAMAQPATEIVLGLRRDATFGPIVMVGLGGVFVEILEDVAFLRAPFSEDFALDAIARLKGAAILNGARGRPVVDRQALARAMVALSQLALAHPQIEELDLNPVFAGPDGVIAVDWLMTRRG
jgi:succinyl-CoA synthetase beta subunit